MNILSEIIDRLSSDMLAGIPEDQRGKVLDAYLGYLGASGFLRKLAAVGDDDLPGRTEVLIAQQKEREEEIAAFTAAARTQIFPWLAWNLQHFPFEQALPATLHQLTQALEEEKVKREFLGRFTEGFLPEFKRARRNRGCHLWKFHHPFLIVSVMTEVETHPWTVISVQFQNVIQQIVGPWDVFSVITEMTEREPDLVFGCFGMAPGHEHEYYYYSYWLDSFEPEIVGRLLLEVRSRHRGYQMIHSSSEFDRAANEVSKEVARKFSEQMEDSDGNTCRSQGAEGSEYPGPG